MVDALTQAVGTAAQSRYADHHAAPVQGSYQGLTATVVQESPLSMVQDASEEMTFAHSERVEKKLSERKTQTERGRMEELAAQWIEKLPNVGTPEKFLALADSLKKSGDRSADALKRSIEGFSSDVSEQFAALSFLEEAFADDPTADDLLESVRKLRSELEQSHGPAVRSGLNVSANAAEFPELGSVQDLRDFYRQLVLGFSDVGQAHAAIVERYGAERFPQATEFLISSIGAEIRSLSPSLEPNRLKAVMDDLFHLQMARNVQSSVGDLLGKLKNAFGLQPALTASEFTTDFMSLRNQRWIDPNKITALVERVGVKDLEAQIYALRELHQLTRRLPDKAFDSLEARVQLADAVQSALDQAISKEAP